MNAMIDDGEYTASLRGLGFRGMVRQKGRAGLTAGGFPVKPPVEWFSKPRLRELTPLTVESDGRVFGHIAAWHQSHIGMAGSIKPPKSKSRYAFFQTGQLETADGSMIDVGQITLTGGHAPLDASVSETVAHYDNTQSAVMDVAVFEDRHGILVAGALRPDIKDEQLRQIRASGVSGDWRPINGNLELVAVCAVNVPGFPIPRARVASGTPVALVAAGIEPLIALSKTPPKTGRALRQERVARLKQRRENRAVVAALGAVHNRLERLEARQTATAVERRNALDDAIRAAASDETAALRSRVHGATAGGGYGDDYAMKKKKKKMMMTSGGDDMASQLRNRVHGMKAASESSDDKS